MENTELKEIVNEQSESTESVIPREKGTHTGKPQKKSFVVPVGVFVPVVSILLVISLVFMVVASVMTVLYFTKDGHKAVYSSKSDLDLADSSQDRIPLYNYALGDISIPAADGVPKAQYDEDGFIIDEKGFMHYYHQGEDCSYVGVDVSSFNGEIDWERVKAAGVDFAMLRISAAEATAKRVSSMRMIPSRKTSEVPRRQDLRWGLTSSLRHGLRRKLWRKQNLPLISCRGKSSTTPWLSTGRLSTPWRPELTMSPLKL